jgi:D-lactate dehydrogenase
MKLAVFSAKSYDIEHLSSENSKYNYEIEFFEVPLRRRTANLAAGADAVCAFVNDKINRDTLTALSELNIGIVALRCAGFNNVDLDAADELGIRIIDRKSVV